MQKQGYLNIQDQLELLNNKENINKIDKTEILNMLSGQAINRVLIIFFIKAPLLKTCRRRGSNPHEFLHTHLKRTCLPFHHSDKNDCTNIIIQKSEN